MLTWRVLFPRVWVKIHFIIHPGVRESRTIAACFTCTTNTRTLNQRSVTKGHYCVCCHGNCSWPPVGGGPQVPSMVLMVEVSSASISFSNSSPLDDSLSPVRYSLISFFFWSGVPFRSTSSSSSELKTQRETTFSCQIAQSRLYQQQMSLLVD